jgi:hypothetical protein
VLGNGSNNNTRVEKSHYVTVGHNCGHPKGTQNAGGKSSMLKVTITSAAQARAAASTCRSFGSGSVRRCSQRSYPRTRAPRTAWSISRRVRRRSRSNTDDRCRRTARIHSRWILPVHFARSTPCLRPWMANRTRRSRKNAGYKTQAS